MNGLTAYEKLPDLLQRLKEQAARPHCFMFRQADEWLSWSTSEVLERIDALTLGFHELGVRKGDKVCLVGPTCQEWALSYLALASMGAVTVPMFLRIAPDYFTFQLEDAEVSGIITVGAERAVEVDVHEHPFRWRLAARLGDSYSGATGRWEECLERGMSLLEEQQELLAELRATVDPKDTQIIIYTSGTSGRPKGVELTQQNLSSIAVQIYEFLPWPERRRLFMLPFAHVYESTNLLHALYARWDCAFVEEVTEVAAAAQALKPHMFATVPRFLEKVQSRMFERTMAVGGLKGWIGRLAINVANNGELRGWRKLLHPLVDRLVFSKWRAALGGNIEFLISGSAPLADPLNHFFCNIGVQILEGYGLTENCAVLTCNPFERPKVGSVGIPMGRTEIKIGKRDEILARGPQIMKGYYKRPEVTAETVDEEGWLHTGDCGSLDEDGYLFITGRVRDIQKTSAGKMVVPTEIELALTHTPLIEQALVIAERRPAVGALLVANAAEVARIEELFGDKAPTRRDERAQEIIDQVNAKRPRWAWVKTWAWLDEEMTVDNELLTPTMKVRRKKVEERYADLIDSMFNDGPEKH